MPLSVGDRLGPYEIVSALGKGGMGEVWRARDPRLNRDVAVKVSAQQFTDRFERESRAIAALNHPHICTLFDIGPNYLVMELVEGPTLAERIAEGPIPVDEALAIAIQIAEALEAAHEKGIVHRDLKPANIKIRHDGSVKVLDFGLAKCAADATVSSDSQTTLSVTGMILGTAGYMAPEQARGKTVDKRADIWAFGVVLYEMITAERLFHGETVSDTLAAVLTRDPDWTRVPWKAQRLLRRCLEKDPAKRLHDISGVELLLSTDLSLEQTAAQAPVRGSHSRLAWIAALFTAALFALAAAALALIHFRETPLEIPLTALYITPPERAAFLGGNGSAPAISPDGRQVIFEAIADGKRALWLRSLDSLDAQPLAGTEGASFPFWSPDSKWIAFFAGGKLKKMPVSGGSATVLADAPGPRGGTWSQAGVIVFAPTSALLQQVSTSGGAASPVAPQGAKVQAERFPQFLPDGRHFLYMRGSAREGASIRIGSLDSPAQDQDLLDGAESLAIFSGASQAKGNLLYLRGTTLVARPFDPKGLTFAGEAVPVAEQIEMSRSINGVANFSVSRNGVLLYERGSADLRLTWFDRAGKRLSVMGDAGDFAMLQLSPNRKVAAVAGRELTGSNVDIWLYDVLRAIRTTRFTSDPAADLYPVWSPDGRMIIFRSTRSAALGDLYRKPADGSRNEELLYADNLQKTPGGFSPDGGSLVYMTSGEPKTGNDIWILPDPLVDLKDRASDALKPYPFLRTEFNEQYPQFSPDGHWIAYQSNESGRYEVYVAPFPGPGGKQQISGAGGSGARWREDGKELFYIAPDDRLMAAQVSALTGGLEVKKVGPLFGPLQGAGGQSYDVSADGQRFLAVVPPEGETAAPLTVVQNWTSGLKK